MRGRAHQWNRHHVREKEERTHLSRVVWRWGSCKIGGVGHGSGEADGPRRHDSSWSRWHTPSPERHHFHCKCGKVEDVVGALTPVGSGVAQVFHDLLVELRLLLVAEVEEEEEEGQEESEEVTGGSQVEETTTTWMAMMMVVSGVRTRLELEPM